MTKSEEDKKPEKVPTLGAAHNSRDIVGLEKKL